MDKDDINAVTETVLDGLYDGCLKGVLLILLPVGGLIAAAVYALA